MGVDEGVEWLADDVNRGQAEHTCERIVGVFDDSVLVGDEVRIRRGFEQRAIPPALYLELALGLDNRFVLCAQLLFRGAQILKSGEQLCVVRAFGRTDATLVKRADLLTRYLQCDGETVQV